MAGSLRSRLEGRIPSVSAAEVTSRFPWYTGKEPPRAKVLLAGGLRLLWIKAGCWIKLNRERE